MMRQWYELKAKAGDALLFFRLGDFYELFEEDALKAAPILGVTLTARNNRGQSTNSSPLCGVPVATIENYLHRALNKGLKIALAEQTEEPKPGKILVKREIVQWFTPGIRFLKNDDQPHYAAVVSKSSAGWTLAAADVGTGHVVLEIGNGLESLQEIIDRLPIQDLRFADSEFANLLCVYKEKTSLLFSQDADHEIQNALQLASSDDIQIHHKIEGQVLGTLFKILRDAHPIDRLRYLKPRSNISSVWMTAATRKNLYLFEPEDRSLFKFLDKTLTAAGRRELKDLLLNPTQDTELIASRQKLVAYFKQNSSLRQLFRARLNGIYDLHRLLRRRSQPEVLVQIMQSLSRGLGAARSISAAEALAADFIRRSELLTPLCEQLEASVQMSEDGEWGWIKNGVNRTLDELRDLKKNSQKLLSDLELKLRNESGVSSLKIKFHQVFGYIAEVTLLHRDKIPSSAKRIQTLANAERFKTTELEQLEEKILKAYLSEIKGGGSHSGHASESADPDSGQSDPGQS
jgi:DNA mismatch repair protein MutS